MGRRQFLAGSLAAAALVPLYADEIGRHELEVTERTFRLDGLPPSFDGFRIVQISDIHLEEYTEDFFLRKVIARVNALRADMVLITGDFVSRGPLPVEVAFEAAAHCGALLSGLTCPQRFGVLGNHDMVVGGRVVRDHMENNGIPLLQNEFIRIERGGEHFFLSGLDDVAAGVPNLSLAVPEKPDAPVVMMMHEPDYAVSVVNHRRAPNLDLVLCGHTHGGQVRLPGLRPLALPPMGKLFPEGTYRLGHIQMYVNRGIGTVGVPLRLNCPAEITVATLRCSGEG